MRTDVVVRRIVGPLSDSAIEAVLGLADEAEAIDGFRALGEQTLLRLRADGTGWAHVVAYEAEGLGRGLVGYAQLDLTTNSAELVVRPTERRGGVGHLLANALLIMTRADRTPLRVWAHGDLPGARALAKELDLSVRRELLVLSAPTAPGPDPELLGMLRTFRPGQDEQAVLAVNAAAFAHHPEQGRLTLADLQQREAEPWFDPELFFLVWSEPVAGPPPENAATEAGATASLEPRTGTELLAFVWLKVDEDGGELYVLGVAPAAQGRGFGAALTELTLRRLAARGLDRVVLYVDGDNTAARRLYERAGFTEVRREVQFGR